MPTQSKTTHLNAAEILDAFENYLGEDEATMALKNWLVDEGYTDHHEPDNIQVFSAKPDGQGLTLRWNEPEDLVEEEEEDEEEDFGPENENREKGE